MIDNDDLHVGMSLCIHLSSLVDSMTIGLKQRRYYPI